MNDLLNDNKNEPRLVEFYTTKDRFEIYTLLSADCKIDGLESGDELDPSIRFRFEDRERCRVLIRQMLAGTLMLPAHKMINAIRTAHTVFRTMPR